MSEVGTCPFELDRTQMQQGWEHLTFLHWPYRPDVVQGLLPPWLSVDTFDGAAWVGLVPFVMHARSAGGRAAPWASRFAETNVRTYVRDADGRAGVWFLSLEAARWGAVVAGRQAFGLPYHWAEMRVVRRAGTYGYRSVRRWPGRRGTCSSVRVEVGERRAPQDVSELEHFLTARWRLFSERGGRGLTVPVWHEPWALHDGEVLGLDDELVAEGGLPRPTGTPLVHVSPGVDVRIGPAEPVGPTM